MVDFYYAIASSIANLQNIEDIISQPPHSLEGAEIPLAGPTLKRTLSNRAVREGAVNVPLPFSFMTVSDYRTFIYSVFGSFTTQSADVYVTAISEDGYWSPFLVTITKPYPNENYQTVNSTWRRNLSFPGFNWILQEATIDDTDSPYSLTTGTRLLNCDTSAGSITVNLMAASTPNANTVFSFRKTSASNTLTLDGNGAETIDGNTTLALTANNARVDIVSDGVSAWRTVTA